MKNQKPNIFVYLDFKKYLEEFKKINNFSHDYICNLLGRNKSRTYLNDIIKGRKYIGTDVIDIKIMYSVILLNIWFIVNKLE